MKKKFFFLLPVLALLLCCGSALADHVHELYVSSSLINLPVSVQTDEAGRPVPASFTVEVHDTDRPCYVQSMRRCLEDHSGAL